jgi:hypothetical protein
VNIARLGRACALAYAIPLGRSKYKQLIALLDSRPRIATPGA